MSHPTGNVVEDSKWYPTATPCPVKWSSFPNFKEEPPNISLIDMEDIPPYPTKDMEFTEVIITINEERLRELIPGIDPHCRTRTCPVAQCITPLLELPWQVNISPAWCNLQYKTSDYQMSINTLNKILQVIPSLSIDLLMPVKRWITDFDEATILSIDEIKEGGIPAKFSDTDYIKEVYDKVGLLNVSMYLPTHVMKSHVLN